MKPLLFILLIAVLAFGCHQSYNEKKGIAGSADTISVTGFTGDSMKLVKTAALRFKVKDVEKSIREVSDVAHRFTGMIYNEAFENTEGDRQELKIGSDSLMVIATSSPQAEITARIPSQHLEVFLYAVSDLGYFTGSSSLHIDDKSLSYLENVLKQKNRREVLSQSTAKSKSPTSLQTIGVKDEITEQQVRNRAIDADVQYSTVNLSLYQNAVVRKEVIANYVASDYTLPYGTRLLQAFANGWAYFLSAILVIVNLWMFIALALAIYLIYRYLNKRRLSIQ